MFGWSEALVHPEQQISAVGAQQESLGPSMFAAQTDADGVGFFCPQMCEDKIYSLMKAGELYPGGLRRHDDTC